LSDRKEDPQDSTQDFEKASQNTSEEKYILRLYVAGMSPRSVKAIENIRKICEENLKGRYELDVIDVYQQPEYAKKEQLLADAKEQIERERAIFESSLSQTSRQVIEALKQEIKEKVFHKELLHLLKNEMSKPEVLSRLINAVIGAIEKEGIESNLSVYIPEAVPAREVNALLLQNILDKLQEKSVLLGPISGGIALKLHDKNITIEITDSALEELIERYSRRDFHEIIFKK